MFANDLVLGYGKKRREGKLWMTAGLPAAGWMRWAGLCFCGAVIGWTRVRSPVLGMVSLS